MSDEPKEAKEAKDAKDGKAPAAEGAAAPAARPKEAPLVVLIAVVAGALIAGAALGSLLVAPRVIKARQAAAVAQAADPHAKKDKKDKKDKKEKKGEAGKSPIYKLDNIIVNPSGSQGQRFLMCSVAIESEDSKALDVLREHEIELRDRVVTMLSQQTLEQLTGNGARDSLRISLLHVINPVLGPDAADADLKVYVPQFVVQ